MTLSVIIPAYNHAEFLAEAIDSALAQTTGDIEVIVVDDGSTDGTPAVLARYDDQVRAIRQDNAGVSVARNRGLGAATGTYVNFLDADDRLAPNFAAVLSARLRAAPATVAAAYCAWRTITERGDPQGGLMRGGPDGDLRWLLLDRNLCPPHALMFRRTAAATVGGFDARLGGVADWDFNIRLAHTGGQFAYVDQALVDYRIVPGSMSRHPDLMLQDRLHLIDLLSSRNPPVPVDSRQRARMAGVAHVDAAAAWLAQGEEARGVAELAAAAQVCPSLLAATGTYYALLCADQPPGFNGTAFQVDIARGAERAVAVLDVVLRDPHSIVSPDLAAAARGELTTTVALLYYGQRDLRATRHWLFRAILQQPGRARDPRVAGTFARTLLGRRLLARYGRRGRAGAGASLGAAAR